MPLPLTALRLPVRAAGLLLVGAPVLAAGPPAQWQLTGGLARACAISFDCQAGDRCAQLRLDDRSTNQDTAVVTWNCNFAVDTATMDFSSLNQGTLKNAVDDIPLAYRASFTGDQGSGFWDRTLATPIRTTPVPTTPNGAVSGVIQIRIATRTEALFAGRYSDRITVTITPDAP